LTWIGLKPRRSPVRIDDTVRQFWMESRPSCQIEDGKDTPVNLPKVSVMSSAEEATVHSDGEPSDSKLRRPALTWIAASLCIVLTAIYHLGPRYPGTAAAQIAALLVQPSYAIWNGRYFSLLTDVFVHAGGIGGIPWHLILNLLYLIVLGKILEQTLRPFQWIA